MAPTNLSATLTSGASGVSGKTVTFKLNGTTVGTATTTSSGVATLSNASLAGINAGSYANGVSASFAGDTGFESEQCHELPDRQQEGADGQLHGGRQGL